MAERFNFHDQVWDQSTYLGRFKYFAWVTDMRLNFVGDECLDRAKTLRSLYLQKREPADTTREQLLYAKKLYDSAFHPDSGEKMNIFGRMSFQVPGGMLLTGAMLTFYRTVPALVFWQWMNQSFNALVNYTNRNANSPLSTTQMGIAYATATSAACVTAIGFKSFLMKRSGPLLQRYVPFAAVAAANCVNIPLMRQNELINGIEVVDADGNPVGESRIAAAKGISEVVISRIVMCAPGMTILPIIMEQLEKNVKFRQATWSHAPFQTLMCGVSLTLMVPAACALFPQKCSIDTETVKKYESEKYSKMKEKLGDKVPQKVYFNKGL